MTATLRPLREDEYAAWLEKTKLGYARSMVDDGGVTEEAAREKADRDHARLLRHGLETKDHFIFAIEDGGDVVGSLWLAARDDELGRSMFVYAIEIDEQQRGRGVGRAAMLLAEEETRSRGLDNLTLNVFGGNDRARGLYRSLGYRELAVAMRKDL